MQLLEYWDPLNLPRGSIRALLTLGLLGVLWAHMLLGNEVPLTFACVMLLVLGHYFGLRSPKAPPAQKPKSTTEGEEAPEKAVKTRAPLGLPRGSVRTIIVLGFAAVTYFMWQADRLHLEVEETVRNNNLAILCLALALIAGFLLRVFLDLITRGKAVGARRWFENLKAVLAVVAGGVLALFSFIGTEEPSNQMVALIAAPLVAFYFGSRH